MKITKEGKVVISEETKSLLKKMSQNDIIELIMLNNPEDAILEELPFSPREFYKKQAKAKKEQK